MNAFLIDDPLLEVILKGSSLTKNQFLAYLIKKGKNRKILEGRLEIEKIFRTKGALAGSFIQARNNIKNSLLTILLLFYLDVWSDKEKQVIISLIEGLKKVVEGSKDRKSDVALYIMKIVESMI